jgi:hypothetical protein
LLRLPNPPDRFGEGFLDFLTAAWQRTDTAAARHLMLLLLLLLLLRCGDWWGRACIRPGGNVW